MSGPAETETRIKRTLHKLELSDRLAKLFPFMDILHGVVKRGLHQPVRITFNFGVKHILNDHAHTQEARRSKRAAPDPDRT